MYDEQVKLYVKCPNILTSMYTQNKLVEAYGFEILGKKPHFTDRFVIITPPTQCGEALSKKSWSEMKRHQQDCKGCHKYENDKQLIVAFETTMDRDGNFSEKGKDKNWIEMFDALKLIAMVNKKLI